MQKICIIDVYFQRVFRPGMQEWHMLIFHAAIYILKASFWCNMFDLSLMLSQTPLPREPLQMSSIKWRTWFPRGDVAWEIGPRCEIKVSGRFSGYSFLRRGQTGKKWKWSLMVKEYLIHCSVPHFSPCHRRVARFKQGNKQTCSPLKPVQYLEWERLKSHRLSCPSVSTWVFVANHDALFT